jgi:hypothetical protein
MPGSLLGPLDDSVAMSPIGRVVGPFDALGQGWFVLRVEERRPAKVVPLEAQKSTLADLIKQRKQRAAAGKAVRALRTRYRYGRRGRQASRGDQAARRRRSGSARGPRRL